ncbi:MAG: glycosyltransferase family 2 protein [Flexilinea sp.]|nr:glycosyltransferase family 2 protein [Flexilinea sp.]
MENDLISMIVPIYNVERYLKRCLESILNQTYRQIEIILIDDGSTDSCGRICDNYREKDDRITIFHTENRGLSAARNLGIDHAHGEWIMFIDPDDWVEPDFCRIPLLAAREYDADLVTFQSRSWKNGHIVHPLIFERLRELFQNSGTKRPVGIVSKETAVQFGGAAAWNKLYYWELFNEIRYPEGRVYEDIAATHKLIYKAKRNVLISDILYDHAYRTGSITYTNSEENKRDGFLSAKERYDFLNDHGYPSKEHQVVLWGFALGLLVRTESDDEMVRDAENILDSIPGFPKGWPLKKKIMLQVWKIDKKLFHLICKMCGKKKTRGISAHI